MYRYIFSICNFSDLIVKFKVTVTQATTSKFVLSEVKKNQIANV